MAIQNITPEEELLLLRMRAGGAAQISRPALPAITAAPKPPLVTWGGVVKGVKTITKVTFVTVGVLAAFVFMTGFVSGLAAMPALSPYLAPLATFMQAGVGHLMTALGAAGTWLSTLSLANASAAAVGGEAFGGTAIAAAGVTGATVLAKQAALGQQAATQTIADMAPHIAAKKATTVSQIAALPDVSTDTTLLALPDGPKELQWAARVLEGQQAAQATQQANTSLAMQKAAMKTAAHTATDEALEMLDKEKHARTPSTTPSTRVQSARQASATWAERIASTAPNHNISRS